MRKIIVTEFITLDGVIESPGVNGITHKHGGWQARHPSAQVGKYKVDELASVDTLLLGRKTYDAFAENWPKMAGEPFADRMNSMPKYVVSKTLQNAEWSNSHVLRDLATEIDALKTADGGNILVYGSSVLVQALLKVNLVDELRLLVYPLSIGGGQRIFDEDLQFKNFELKHSEVFDAGVILCEYQSIS